MIRRVLSSSLLALCLVLTSLAAVVAETRWAAAGEYCGTGAPRILLDHAGLPLLDADGAAISAPDCTVCHLAFALATPSVTPAQITVSFAVAAPLSVPTAIPQSHGSDRHARAPPRLA